ncbi:hypothetical protein GCM10009550_79200 [Actinocorallia libanotica]|uniref:Uncharacterized protein n=1 Tax=Actinocorallia libanotica TaxID=46162 RepID=A0ABN1S2M8_9ACTN
MTGIAWHPCLLRRRPTTRSNHYDERRALAYVHHHSGPQDLSRGEDVLDAPETAVGLPPKLTRQRNAVLHPRDAADAYAHPRPEPARLARLRTLQPVAYKYTGATS